MEKLFTMKDENFTCSVCGTDVKKLEYTARDHCPNCLCSIHIDNFPGDRSCECKGTLAPIGLEKFKKGFKIVYKCKKCGQIKKNIAAVDDNQDAIIQLSASPF